jgi:tRNA(fMet)-specific endonuclease VapC
MVCIDTDILIDFLKQKEYAVKKIKELKDVNNFLATTSINSFELFRGVIKSENIDSIKPLNILLSNLKIYNFNILSSKKAAEIFENLKSKGELLDLADIMIASIAISNNETLLTNNISHFKRIPELKLESL